MFVPQIVQVETVWVLETAYALKRDETVAVLEHLSANAVFELQGREQFGAALQGYREGGADFSDYLILAESRASGAELLTFDRRLLKSAGTRAP